MNFEASDKISTDGKRAAHVKWEGKTIALGTFSTPQEAVEKCDQAKELTRKWRTTMTPRPSVEWVKATLEHLNIRVVNDRPGRRKKRSIEDVDQNTSISMSANSHKFRRGINGSHISGSSQLSSSSNIAPLLGNISHGTTTFQGGLNFEANGFMMGGVGDVSGRSMDRRLSNSTECSYYGISSSQDTTRIAQNNDVFNPLPTLGNLSNVNNSATLGLANSTNPILNYQQQQMLSNFLLRDRPQRLTQRSNSVEQRLATLIAFGCNQHCEALKEHHRNLLKELQETTALMNMYYDQTQNYTDTLFRSN